MAMLEVEEIRANERVIEAYLGKRESGQGT